MQRRKKLIEVALPLEAINKEAAREKSIRHGHPSTLHLWWARRPLAACRAVLFAQLVDDPSSDPQYRIGQRVDEERAGEKRAELFNLIEDLVKWENSNNPDIINKARAEIARCVASRKIELGDLKQETVIFGRDEGKAHPNGPISTAGVTAYEMVLMRCTPEVVNHFLATYAPPVLDPFAGGGSIPLEAQRLGLRAHASDLNPVPVLINKALIEIPPKFAGQPPVNPKARSEYLGAQASRPPSPRPSATPLNKGGRGDKGALPGLWNGARGLAEDVRYYGEWMRNEAEKRIGHLYPKVEITQDMIEAGRDDLEPYLGQELTVIAWLWARTVESSNPAYSGVHVPLVTTLWLSKKKGKETWLEPEISQSSKRYAFRVRTGKPSDEYKEVVEAGTKLGRGCKFRCILSDTLIPEEHIKGAGQSGKLGATLLAAVCEGTRGRVYISATDEMEQTAKSIEPCDSIGIDAPLANDPRNLWCLGYGLDTFEKLFTSRQLTALTTFSDLVSVAREQAFADAQTASVLPDDETPLDENGTGSRAYADAVATYLGLALSRLSDALTSLTTWIPKRDQVGHTFGRQALPMVWDYAESNLFNGKAGDFGTTLNTILRTLNSLCRIPSSGSQTSVKQRDVTSPVTYSGEIITTDPPYYDNVGYADLSDFFYVWLRRTLKGVYPSLLSTMLTPKAQELIASPYRHEGSKDKAARFFEDGLGNALGKWREHGHVDYPTTIFYAFKQAETDAHGTASTGWETFLTGVVQNGFTITGTWPIRTERSARSIAMGTNALASSIVLSCVPRSAEAGLATRREFLNALTRELPDALHTLQAGNIAPVDLAQAAIGPGMALFSRYAKVIEADGSPMSVRTALALINQVLDEVLAEHEGEFDADTRWAVAWFEQYGVEAGDFGVAETLSKAKNTSVQGLVDAGVVKSRSGTVQLLSREELPADWDPIADQRLTEWEATHYLIRALDLHGERGASDMLRTLGSDYGEKARALAYRLYNICERKKWASEATAYNSLVIAWPEMNRLALAGDGNEGQVQARLLQ